MDETIETTEMGFRPLAGIRVKDLVLVGFKFVEAAFYEFPSPRGD